MSNPDYRLWISQLGGTDVATNAIIDHNQQSVCCLHQPTIEHIHQDRIKIFVLPSGAVFDKSVTGSIVYTNDDDEYLNAAQFSSTRFNIGEKIRG